jgi:hypothetical protein
LLKEFGDPGVGRSWMEKRRLFKEWKRNFRKLFFLLEVWDTLETIFCGRSIMEVGEVLKKFGEILGSKQWLLPTAHLVWKAGMVLGGSPIHQVTVFRPDLLADSSMKSEVTLLDVITQIQFGLPESDALVSDYAYRTGRAAQEAEARFTRVINEDTGE